MNAASETPLLKWVKYAAATNGATGHCTRCTKAARDAAYPLTARSGL